MTIKTLSASAAQNFNIHIQLQQQVRAHFRTIELEVYAVKLGVHRRFVQKFMPLVNTRRYHINTFRLQYTILKVSFGSTILYSPTVLPATYSTVIVICGRVSV